MSDIEDHGGNQVLELDELREQIRELESFVRGNHSKESLQLEAELCRSLLDDSPVLLVTVEPDGRILMTNDAMLRLIGRTKEEVIGREYLTRFVPECDHEALSKVYGDLVAGPKVMRLETGLITGDGLLRLIEWHGREGLDATGQAKVTYCVGMDITEIRQNTDELQQTKEYLENILENSPDAIGIVDSKGCFIKWNRMAEELYGYSFDELRGKNAFDLYADSNQLLKMLIVLSSKGFIKNHEINMKRKDGTILPFDVSISVLKDQNGTVLGSVCVARNLSEIKKALNAFETTNQKLQQEMAERQRTLEALEKSQSEYRTIFENTGNATVIIEEDTVISLANAEFVRISGCTLEEIQGKKSWTEFFTDDTQVLMREYHRLRLIDPNAARKSYEARFRSGEGLYRDMYLTVATIPGTRKSVVSFLDITERKQAEQELRRSHAELEQRSYEISLLNEMLNLLQVCGTGDETYYVLGNYIQKLFPSDSGCLYLLKTKTTLEVVCAWGEPLTSNPVFEYNDCWALRQGKVHMVEESGGVHCQHLTTAPSYHYLCVPMIAQGEVMGMLHLQCCPSGLGENTETRRKIMYLKQRLAIAITDHIGLALANLNMRETLRLMAAGSPQ
jgi:PAS domain S-box-containing protein